MPRNQNAHRKPSHRHPSRRRRTPGCRRFRRLLVFAASHLSRNRSRNPCPANLWATARRAINMMGYWNVVVLHFAHYERVIAGHLPFAGGYICLRSFCLLVLESVTNERAVERLVATIEGVDCVAALELFDTEGMRQSSPPRSKTLGSWRSLSRRAEGCSLASRAF